MEMSVDKFNELRFSVAQVHLPCSAVAVAVDVAHASRSSQALKSMYSLGSNPLFKLMEASKQRSLATSK
jgi:hypothetical protein